MKNQNRHLSVVTIFSSILLFSLVSFDGYCQKKTKPETAALFPEPVSGILNSSCVGCHSDEGSSKAKLFMNLSEWDKLSQKKQMKTARKMNKKVAKGAMPPSGFLEKHPEAALTPEKIKNINDWAVALQKAK